MIVLSQFTELKRIATGVLASTAVLGLIVGFAAQHTIANMVADEGRAIVLALNKWDLVDNKSLRAQELRTEADRRALIEGLRSGVIDCVATDHAPHAVHEKEVPFEQAPMGTTGLETAFAAIYTELVLPGVIELALLVERLTSGAALFELPTPKIAPGEPANLTLIDLDAEYVAGERGWESRSENCCFAGRTLRGRVLLTVASGAIAFRERAFSVVGA